MKNIRYSLLTCLLIFITGSQLLIAQSAEKLYQNHGYAEAIPLLERGGDVDLETMIRIANSYRLTGDFYNAERWYAQVVESSGEAIHKLHYAQALMANEKYAEAKKYFLEYDALAGGTDERGAILAAATDRVRDMKTTDVTVKNLHSINTEYHEYSPLYYKNSIVFVSSRGLSKPMQGTDQWTGHPFMNLFQAEMKEDGTLKSPREFSEVLSTKYHEGPMSFNKSGNIVYFTRNNYNRGKRGKSSDGTTKLKIYRSVKQGSIWSAPEELPFNDDEHTYAHPAISPDGNTLVFASDRPGGFGGLDLYVSYFRNGSWTAPKNLGPEINTPGHDAFPSIHDDHTLYFSSDGHPGLGGYDIFAADYDGENWGRPYNIGKPFNSSKDDIGFIINTTGTEGFFSSNRDGGFGGDDLYSFMAPRGLERKDRVLMNTICVYDVETNQRIPGAKVTVSERLADGTLMDMTDEYLFRLKEVNKDEYTLRLIRRSDDKGKTETFTTDENGEVEYDITKDRNYVFRVEKDGYKPVVMEYSTEGMDRSELREYCIPLERADCVSLQGLVINSKYGNRLPGVNVRITNMCTGDEHELVSNIQGEFSFPCLDCGCDFVIVGWKRNFKEDYKTVSTRDIDCDQGTPISVTLEMIPAYGYAGDPSQIRDGSGRVPSFGGFMLGDVIELDAIYYDFDKYEIRADARPILDEVAELLRNYPSMVIELGAHTDSRGSRAYNQRLSERRANAAVEYLVGKGIAKSRLVAKGYGQTQLRNGCGDGVQCTEEEHQYNRRTEIKVLSVDQDIEIQYRDNKPEYIDRAPGRR
jgi:outer membrane protein OmpA-like peptidoglycan-associated protein